MIPDFDSLYTLFSTVMAFLFSLTMFFTRGMEKNESSHSEE